MLSQVKPSASVVTTLGAVAGPYTLCWKRGVEHSNSVAAAVGTLELAAPEGNFYDAWYYEEVSLVRLDCGMVVTESALLFRGAFFFCIS